MNIWQIYTTITSLQNNHPIIPIIIVLLIVLLTYGEYRFFIKCNQQGWKALIPFYNVWILCTKIASLHLIFPTLIIISEIQPFHFATLNTLLKLTKFLCYSCTFYNIAIRSGKETTTTTLLGSFISRIMILLFGINKNFICDTETQVEQFSFLVKYFSRKNLTNR